MVTGDEEIKYGYLLDPCFQMVNTNGRPLTQGWIECYIAGTRNKYYCSSDFAGTLHPFKIPLDSLGSNIILADVENSYDVYVYNKYGSLIMSRYNITPGKGGAGGSVSGSGIAEHWIGKNGQSTSIPSDTDTALKLPTSYEYEGFFIDRINENRTAFYLRDGLYLVQAVVNFKQSDQSLSNEISQVDVFTRSDDAPEDMSFNRDMAGPDTSDDSHCLKISFIRCVKEEDEVSQIVLFKVNTPNAWSECYLQNVQIARLSSGAGASGQTYTAGEYISIDDETKTISVTGIDPDAYATHDEVEQAIESATSGYATEQWVLDKHYITSADIPPLPEDLVTSAELAQTSGLIEQDIADLTSSISESLSLKMDKSSSADFYPMATNPSGYLTSIPSEYVTDSEMSGYVAQETSAFLTSAELPSEEEVEFEEIDLSEYAKASAIPDVSDMATQTWVTDQNYITSADIPPQIEYSAGENIDVSGHVISVASASNLYMGDNFALTTSGDDYYLALSGVSQLTPGSYISITSANDTYEISCTGLQPAGDYVDSAYVSSYVDSAVSGKQDTLTFSYDSSDKISAINGSALAGGGAAQVNSDWDAVSGVAEILNKPDTEEVEFEELETSSFVDSAYVTSYVTSQTSGKQDTLTFGYTDNKISSINSSAIYSTGGGGGGGDVFYAECDDVGQNPTQFSDILAAYKAGKTVLLRVIDSHGTAGNRDRIGQLVWINDPAEGWPGYALFNVEYAFNLYNSNPSDPGKNCIDYYKFTSDNRCRVYRETRIDSGKTATVGSILTLTDNGDWPAAIWKAPSFITSADFTLNQSNQITGIDGYAIAGGGGGGGHEYTGINGITVDNLNETIGLDTSASNAIETVIENSGAWGGEGLPISAGPGITISLVSGSIVIGLDTSAVQAMLS